MSTSHVLAFSFALLAIAGMAALPSVAATTADDVGPADDGGVEVLNDYDDLICYFTPYPEDDYPTCVRKIFGP